MEKFNKLLAARMKDKKSGMSDTEKDAKMSVLQHVRDMAQGMMKDKLQGGMKKVEVASDSPKGLAAGLDKAKSMVEGSDEEEASETPEQEAQEDSDDGDESPEAEGSHEGHYEGSDADEAEDMSHMSEDEIDEKLQKLMAMKKMMASKKA